MAGEKDNSQNGDKNILNFRKPHIYIAAVIVVIICSAGFVQFSNPHTDKHAAGNMPLEHRMIEPLARQYGYDSWVILSTTGVGFEVLLYNPSLKSDEDLNAKILLLDGLHKVRGQQAVRLSPELKGYSFRFKRGDFSQDKHLLAYRVLTDKAVGKKYSDLLVMDRNDLRNIRIIQTYEQKEVAQGNIPTIIEFSVDIVGDYVVYEDVDSYWKVQDVRTKEVYNSGDNTEELAKVEPCYMSSGIYLYVLKYIKDNSILAFNTDTKKFFILNGTSCPDYEGYLLGISEKDNTIGLMINGKNADVKLVQNTELLDAKGNKADIEDFVYYNWGKVWLDKKYSGKQFKSGEAVALKVIGIKNDAKDITELGPYTGPADTKDYGAPNTKIKQ